MRHSIVFIIIMGEYYGEGDIINFEKKHMGNILIYFISWSNTNRLKFYNLQISEHACAATMVRGMQLKHTHGLLLTTS